MNFLYFSYGSNMLSRRLSNRCASANLIGTASAKKHTLEFSKKSADGSGKATLIANESALEVPGVLFDIKLSERDTLDRFEGAGNGYERLDSFAVEMTNNGEVITATTYLATAPESGLDPFDWYLALVVAGADEHTLDAGHRAQLKATPYKVDNNIGRKSRIEALRALDDHGHTDHSAILTI